MKENKYLKWLLIIQSFLPLFLLILIRCFCLNNFKLVSQFFIRLFQKDFGVILIALNHPDLFSVILLCLSVIMLIIGIMIYVLFNKIQKFGFCEEHENIAVDADLTENSVAFFVTYITPLVLDDIGKKRGFLSFAAISIMLILLMRNTNLYYQNPFLTILGYKSFNFHFPSDENSVYIGITRGDFDAEKIIKRKRISDNVYLVYNKN